MSTGSSDQLLQQRLEGKGGSLGVPPSAALYENVGRPG